MPGNQKQRALSAAMVRTVNRPGMYADGNGLNLKVVSSGVKRWVQRVTIGGKRHNLGLGGYPAVSLAEARELAAENQSRITISLTRPRAGMYPEGWWPRWSGTRENCFPEWAS